MRMSLHPDLSEISPGDEVELQITVANDATTEVTPIIDVRGLDADLWALANPIPVIAPGAVGRASLRVRLPDDSPPGDRTVAVTARAPGADAGASAVTVLRVGTNFSLAVETDPSSVTGRSGGRLNTVVRNLGDEDLDVTMSGRSEGAEVEMRPATFTLPAGKGARLSAVITPLKRSWFSERRHGVVIEARSGSVPSSTTAMFVQRPTVPPLLLRITAVVLALAVWASVSFVLFDRISGDPEVAAPVDTVVDGGDAGPPADVVLAGAATDEDDAGVTPPVVIAGTVEGPRDPSGSSVLVERVSFGDEGTTGGSTGKIAVGTPVAFSSGTVLEKISATTDEGGRFRVGSGLIADAFYRVTVSRAGFDLTSQVVTTGGGNTEIDLAITLVPGRGEMTGRVTDLAGTALGGAEIVATQGTVTYRTTTASEGEGVGTWQIDGLATPATYLVTVIADGHASQQLTVEVGGGAAVSGVDATMERDRGTIRGALTYRDAGVGAVTVALEGDVSRTTTTLTVGAVAGSFDFPNLPYGTYLLTFSKDGWLTQSREVTVSTGDVAIDVRDLLPSTAIIQGAVSQQVTSGSCSYPDPTAGDAKLAVGSCGGVGVSVIGETGTWRTTTATGDGSFRLSGIPAGEYTVEFERYGYLPEFYRVIVGPGDTLTLPDDATYDVEMAAYRGPSNRSFQPLDDSSIALRLVTATPLDAAVVKGVVRDVSAIDQPFDELTDENDQPLFDDWDDGSGCRSDRLEVEVIGQSVVCQLSSGGGFTLTGVAPGAADVQVTAPGFGSGSVTLQVAAEGETLAGLIPMTPLASLSMNVTGSGDVPVDSAVVFLAPAPNAGDVITYSGATEVRECIVARSDDTDIWQEVASAPAESMSREGLCADSDGSGDLTFDRALGSGTFDVILPVNGADPSGLVELAGVVPLDHRQLVRTIEVQVGVNSRLDVGLRRYASVVGTIQSPDADGSGYTNVTELEGLNSFPLMGTGTDGGGNTVARGVQFCEVETGTDTCKEYALDYVRPRVSFGSASGLSDGQYRIDRIPPNEGTTQREYLFQVFTDDGDFTKGNGRGGPVEGLAFGEERTLSIVTSPQPSTIALDVVWINGTTRTPVTNANARVTGTAGFRTIDIAPFREVITLTCPGADCTTGGMSEDGFTYAITPTATTTDPLEGLFADLDADGRLVIENVYRTGDLTVEIIADGYSSRSVDVLLPRVRSGTVITDAGVVTDGYDVVLAPSPRTVTGSVQIDPSPTDALYEGLAVTLTPAAGGSTVTTSVSAPIGSSSLGTFSFASVSPGTYNLSVTGDGVTAASTSVTVAPGSGTFDIATTIDVGRELLIDATAYECPIGSVCAGTYSSLAPGNYEVVAGATAELESSSDGTTWTRVAVTTTCSDENAAGCAGVGVARFEGLDPSDGAAYRVTFSATGYLASSPVLIGAPTTAETAVVGPLVSYGTITGVVRAALAEDETPSRLAGAAVSLQSADSTVVATTSTGATGRFTFSNSEEIAAGNYTVNVSFPGYSDGSVAVTVTDRNLSSIGDDELDLLAEKVEITGTVTSAAGDDLPHVLVSTVGSGCTPAIASGSDAALKQTCQWTGADGTYSGIEIAPRTTTLVFREYTTSAGNAQQTDRPTVERNVTPSVGAVTLALNVEMGTAIGSVTGIVQLRSYNGAALVPDASVVTVTILDGTDVVTTRTAAANGSFSATDLDTGTYDVRLSATGYQTVTYSGLVIIANGTATVPTQTLFAATRTVQVQVTSSSVALTGLALVLSPPSDLVASSGNGSLAGADPDNDGTYVFEGVAPGDWTLASTNGASLSPRLLDVTGIDVVVDVDTAASGTSIVVPAIEFDTVSGTLNAKAYAGSGATSVPGDARVAIVGAPTVYATPDSGGSWTLRALSGADINVTMTAGGYTSFTTSSAVTVAGQSDVDATLIAKTRDLVVSITSTGPDGATSNLSGVDVSATGPDGTTVTTSSGITDGADGTYTITGAIPGAWSFSTTNGAALTPVHLDASGVSVTVPVDAAATGSTAASAYTGALLGFDAVSGTVTSRRYAGDSASAYAGAVVTSSDDANVSAVTGPDGTWEIRKPVTTTGIGFSVTASGYTSKSVTDSSADAVLTAKVRDVTMSFTSGGSTLDPSTALTVTATPPSDATGLVAVSTSVNAGGVFTLGGLAPGVWTITTAGGADLTPDHLDITTADSITTTVPVDTASSGAGAASAHGAGSVVTFSEVSGIVNDSTGVAAEGVAVRLGAVDITTTDATGAFTLYSPNAKSRELTFFKESAGSASQTVTAPASLTVALTTVSLSVRVLSSDGTALTGVSLTATDGVDTFSQTTASGTGTAVFVGIGTGTWTVDVADGDGVADGVITIGGIQYLVVGPASGTGTGFGPRALTLTESSGVFDVYITPLDKPITATLRRSTDASISVVDGAVVTATSGSVSVTATSSSGAVSFDLSSDRDWSIDVDFTDTATSPNTVYATRTRTVAAGQADGALGVINIATTTRTVSGAITGPAGRTVTVSATAPGHSASVTTFDIDTTSATIDDVDYTLSGLSADVTWRLDFAVDDGAMVTVSRWIGPGSGDVTLDQTVGATAVGSITVAISDLSDAGVRTGPLAVTVTLTEDTAMKSLNADGEVSATVTLVKGVTSGAHTFANLVQPGAGTTVDSGRFTVSLSATNYVATAVDDITDIDPTDQTVLVEVKPVARDVDVTLTASGAALSGASPSLAKGDVTASVTSVGNDYTFANADLRPGNWTLTVPGYATQTIAVPIGSGTYSTMVDLTAVTGAQVAVTTQPVGDRSGAVLATQPVVEVRSADGSTATLDDATVVRAAISSGAGGTLRGTTSAVANDGVATFGDLRLDGVAGTDYVLTFTADGLPPVQSVPVQVTAGAPTDAVITLGATGVDTDAAATTSVSATLVDSGGNVAAPTGTVAITQAGISLTTAESSGTYSATTTTTGTAGAITIAVTHDGDVLGGSVSLLTSPGAPGSLAASAGSGVVHLVWAPPASDGGAAITDYVVEVNTGSGYTTVAEGTSSATNARVPGLANGSAATFRVSATNSVGTGAASATASATPSASSTAPVITAVTPGNGEVTVAYVLDDDGGVTVDDIEVQVDGGTWSALGSTTSPLTVTGLTNGTAHVLRLRPVDASDTVTGDASTAITVTPRTTPGAPTSLTVDARDEELSVGFTAPASTGGASITNYEYSLDSGSTWVALSPADVASPVTITGLTNGVAQTGIKLRAVNAAGAGTASDGTASGTPTTNPTAPVVSAVTPGVGDVDVVVTAPTLYGQSVTRYEYQIDGGAWTSTGGTATSFTIGSLTNGTTYLVRVRAVTSAGNGEASGGFTAMPYATPAAPTSVSASATNGGASIEFTAADSGGPAIRNYEYSLDSGAWTPISPNTTSSPLTIYGLTNGTEYSITIRAITDLANGTASAPAVTVTPVAAPGAPIGLAVSSFDGDAALTWTAPSATGGADITDYIVQYRATTTTTWSTFSDGTGTSVTATVTGLDSAIDYAFRVAAVNSEGTGDYSGEVVLVAVSSASAAQSTISAADSVIDDSGSTTVTVQLVDSQGRNLTASSGAVVISADNSATVGSVTDNGDGTYSATVTATTAGTITVSATLNGVAISDTATIEAADIQLRFSARALSTINGGSPTSGSTLASWNSSVGAVTSSSIVGDPTYVTNGVQFDGDDGLVTSSTALFNGGADDLTFLYVVSPTSVDGQAFILFQEHTNCTDNIELGIDTGLGVGTGNVGLHRGCSDAVVSPSDAIGTSGGHVVVTRVLATGTTPDNVKIDVDGSAVTVSQDDDGWLDPPFYPLGTNALHIAHRDGSQGDTDPPADAFFSGTLHELIVFTDALSDTEVSDITAALIAEYGL